jgi:hypothetical protein
MGASPTGGHNKDGAVRGHHHKIIGANSPQLNGGSPTYHNSRISNNSPATAKNRGHSVDVFNNSVDALSPRGNQLGKNGQVPKNPKSH